MKDINIIIDETRVSVISGCWTNYKIYEENHPNDCYYVDGLEFFKTLKVEIYKNILKRRYKKNKRS